MNTDTDLDMCVREASLERKLEKSVLRLNLNAPQKTRRKGFSSNFLNHSYQPTVALPLIWCASFSLAPQDRQCLLKNAARIKRKETPEPRAELDTLKGFISLFHEVEEDKVSGIHQSLPGSE